MTKHCFIVFFLLTLTSQCLAESNDDMLTGPEIWQELFLPTLIDKFNRENKNMPKIKAILEREGGKIVIDHGATRTADPEVHAFITRIAAAFGLIIHDDYSFPDRHLVAVDLQLPDSDGFKWFSTLIKYEQFSPSVSKLIEEDIENNRPRLTVKGLELLEKLEEDNQLTRDEAQQLVREIIFNYLKRHGHPIKKSTLLKIAEESHDAANALLLGPDFNHLSISMNHLNVPTWYGLEVIEVFEQILKRSGFHLLPKIQGKIGGVLRQTAILADENNFPVLLEDRITSSLSYPSKYVELIQRGFEKDSTGKIIFEGNQPKLYMGFLKNNSEKIYTSTDPKSGNTAF